MTYAVAGVTGRTGRVVAETLISQRKQVRAIVRNVARGSPWKSKGLEVAVADLADTAALAKALQGTEGAYLLIPPNTTEPRVREYQDRIAVSIAQAVQQSKVPHVVFLSSGGAQHASGNGPIAALHDAESRFSELTTTKFSFLRAAYFMENIGDSLGMLDQGILPSYIPASYSFDMVATADIGLLAAELLIERADRTGVVELSGGKYSMNDAAAALSLVTGKPVEVKEVPLETMVPTLTGFGVSAELASMYQEMTRGLISGHVAFEEKHRFVRGTTSLEAVLRGMLAAR